MKWNKDLLAFVVSQLLLVILISLWLRGVYYRELNSLKAETNVLFFNAIEEAKDKLFFNLNSHQDFDYESEFILKDSDSLIRKEVFVFDRNGHDIDSLHHDHQGHWSSMRKSRDSQVEVTVDYSTQGLSAILISSDSLLNIDFDTTKSYLTNILLERINDSRLSRLKVSVVDSTDSSLAEGEFRTDEASLGNIFFGTSEYAAEVGEYKWLVINRMFPEMLIAVLLFLAIFSAFFLIYKNLIREKRLAKMKDDFISNISHELKTPLSVVSVAIEALGKFDMIRDAERTKEYLDISKYELKRLSTMVEKVLNLTSWDNSVSTLVKSEINLNVLVTEVVNSMNVKHGYLESDVLADMPVDPICFNADEEKLKIILYNLLDNALKYSKQKPVELSVSLSDNTVTIDIADRGEGIPQEYKDKIFEKFFRVPNENIHDVKGYGLGLYLVKDLVDLHNGQITIDNREGGGTIVSLTLPTNHES